MLESPNKSDRTVLHKSDGTTDLTGFVLCLPTREQHRPSTAIRP